MPKRFLCMIAMILCLLMIFTACGKPASPKTSEKPSGSASASAVASASSAPSPTGTSAADASEDQYTFQVEYGDFIYYLDEKAMNKEGTMMPLHRMKKDKTGDTNMNLYASDLQLFGNYLYLNMNYTEDAESNGHWDTYRVSPDGKDKKLIAKDIMIINTQNALFYTVYNQSVIYKADMKCENAVKIPVTLPETKEPYAETKKTMKADPVVILQVLTPEDLGLEAFPDSCTYFSYALYNPTEIKNAQGTPDPYFFGYYKIAADNTVQKTDYGTANYSDNRVYTGGYLYYLDITKRVNASDEDASALYSVHRMKEDGTGDTDLKITSYYFDIIGNYIYSDNDSGNANDTSQWKTTRYNLDGSGKTSIKYKGMYRFFVGGKLYFTLSDNGYYLYVGNIKCEKVKKISVKIPDIADIKKKLGEDMGTPYIEVTSEQGGLVYFNFNVYYDYKTLLYTGKYSMTTDGSKVTKLDTGTFADLSTDDSAGTEDSEDGATTSASPEASPSPSVSK